MPEAPNPAAGTRAQVGRELSGNERLQRRIVFDDEADHRPCTGVDKLRRSAGRHRRAVGRFWRSAPSARFVRVWS
jgi:hypothetical protein